MRILHVVPYYYLSWSTGHPVSLVSEMTSALARRGHRVTILTTDVFNKADSGIDSNATTSPNPKVLEMKSVGKFPLFFSFSAASFLFRHVRDYDIVHIHEHRNSLTLTSSLAAERHGVPYIIQAHGALSSNLGNSVFKNMLDWTLGGRALRNASSVIAITHDEATQYERQGVHEERIHVIPNGIDSEAYQDGTTPGAFRSKLGFDSAEQLVIYVGRLDTTKGIDLLIRAFSMLNHQGKRRRLVIVGRDYGAERSLKILAHDMRLDNVIFTGFVQESLKRSALRDSDVFVTPCYSGFPYTFLEAAACGVPIITTARGDKLDWIDGNSGLATEYSAESLCIAIERVLSSSQLKRSLGEGGMKTVRERFDWAVIAVALEKAYQEAIESKGFRA